MKSKMISTYVLAIALVAGLTTTALGAQQSQSKAGTQPKAGQTGMMSRNMADHCKQMMSMHSQMMADMKAMDTTLDQKVAAMNAAKGNAKVDAMAAVINEMASQRKQMMSKMSGMQDQMMAHMGEHMAQSGTPAMHQSMAQCPMMKESH
jgi:CII-binding regulator of phage lambda lysogenization HflD